MQKEILKPQVSLFIRNVCKGKTEEELIEAEQNFIEDLMVVKGISDRLAREGKSLNTFDEINDES